MSRQALGISYCLNSGLIIGENGVLAWSVCLRMDTQYNLNAKSIPRNLATYTVEVVVVLMYSIHLCIYVASRDLWYSAA